MSKYAPLQTHLQEGQGSQVPMTFSEVEKVLGFSLPPSARSHPAWWSNNRGTNVAVKAWRDAGWRTSRVSIPEERVTFVRDPDAAPVQHAVREEVIQVSRDALTGGALKMLEREVAESGADLGDAIATILNITARRRLLEEFARRAPRSMIDSTEVIRAERDER